MAVKKKEKSAPSQTMSGNHKAQSPVQDKAKAANPAKMKNADDQREAKQKTGGLMQQIIAAGQFLNEVRAEARKISWPERSQVVRETISVLFLVALITFFVWGFDLVVGKFIFVPLEHWGHLYGIGGA